MPKRPSYRLTQICKKLTEQNQFLLVRFDEMDTRQSIEERPLRRRLEFF